VKRLNKFILSSYLGPLVLTFFISLFILLMQFLWKYIDDLAGKGLDWTIIAELIVYASARLVTMALPLAILLSSIMTFGNMGENFELIAIKSAGISLQKFMSPLIYLTIIISISAYYYSDIVIPYTNLKTGTLIYDVKHQRPELQIKEGIFYNGIEGYSIKIAKKNHKTNLLQNIMVYDHKNNKENLMVTVADSGYMKMTADESHIILTLYNGYSYEEMEEPRKDRRKTEKKHPHQRNNFEKQIVYFELSGLDFSRSDEDLFKNNFQMLNLKQLEYYEDSLRKEFTNLVTDFSDNLIRTNYFKKEATLVSELKDRNKKPEFIDKKRTPNQNINKIKKNKGNNLRKQKAKKDKPLKIDSLNFNDKNDRTKKLALLRKDSLQGIRKKDSVSLLKKEIDTSIINKKINNGDKINFIPYNVLQELTTTQKSEAIDHALTFARAAQNSVDNSKKQFNYKIERIIRHEIEWHRKFTLSFACFIFFFIGAPLGAIIRKGGFGVSVVISIVFFIFYYILSIAGEKFAREAVMPAYIGMWISSFILMPLGIFLTYKATTDSVIFNADSYLIFFKKIFSKFSKKEIEES